MLFKKTFSFVFFAIFIQSSLQQIHALTEQQTNIASYIIAAGAGAATGGLVFYALEQNHSQQQKDSLMHDVENNNGDTPIVDQIENKNENHMVRNLIIGSVCGVVIGAFVYKITHDMVAPHVIDQEIHFCTINLFIRDFKDGLFREVPIPDDFMLDESPENFDKFLKWIRATYKNSYEYKYENKTTVQTKTFLKESSHANKRSGNKIINRNAPSLIEEMPPSYNTLSQTKPQPETEIQK